MPIAFDSQIAKESLDGVNIHGFVELAAIAGSFTRVIAGAPHDSRQRIVLNQRLPGFVIAALLGVVQPSLNVFAGRTRVIARRQQVPIYWAARSSMILCGWRGLIPHLT